jgi:hypothetical protein
MVAALAMSFGLLVKAPAPPLLVNMNTRSCFAISGIVLNAVGVIVLFRFAMPYKVRKEGPALLWRQANAAEKSEEAHYDIASGIGLALVIVGAALQAWGARQ